MDNTEKAQEIAESCYSKRTKDIPANRVGQLIIKQACLEMAKWKDEQMQETIEVAEDHAFFAGSYREREKFEDEKDEIKTDAKKELAWEIHKKISEGASIADLDDYICKIVDF